MPRGMPPRSPASTGDLLLGLTIDAMDDVRTFYDDLAPLYHLVYENWEASVARQGSALASLIGEHWGAGARTVLDAAVGIGTQALGLLALGFRVTGSDLSHAAVNRAQREAATR